MTVKELICKLQNLPENSQVYYPYDGSLSSPIYMAYESNDGDVVLSSEDEVLYSENNIPRGKVIDTRGAWCAADTD